MSLFHSLLYSQSGGATEVIEFSGATRFANGPVLDLDGEDWLRNQSHFFIDETTLGMSYSIGSETTINYATSSINDPHNYTKQGVLLDAAEGEDIDGLSIAKNGNDWCGFYGDRATGTIGMALRSGTFGEFTRYESNPVLDFTAETEAGYRYLRHPSKPIFRDGKWWIVVEGRQALTGASNRKIYAAYCEDTFPNLVNWTLVTTPIFDPANYPGTLIGGQEAWMPDIEVDENGRAWIVYWNFNQRSQSDSDKGVAGFSLLYCDAEDIGDAANWTPLNTIKPFIHQQGICGQWDQHEKQEASFLFLPNGEKYIYYNGKQATQNSYKINYYTLQRGTFLDEFDPNFFEEDWADESLNTDKWETSEVSGITVTEENGVLTIQADGSGDAALATVITNKSAIKRSENAIIVVECEFDRTNISGGDVQFGLFNADDSKSIRFGKASTYRTIQTLATQGSYTNNPTSSGVRFKIVLAGCYASFWEFINGVWVNLTTGAWLDISAWDNTDDLFFRIQAQNVSGQAYTATFKDVSIRTTDSLLIEPFNITTNIAAREKKLVLANGSALTAQEETALGNFVEACLDNGNWDLLINFLCLKLNETDSLRWLKKLVTATNNGATHGANGYTFDGTDDYIDSGINLRTSLKRYVTNNAGLSVFVHTAGDQAANRIILGGVAGSDGIRLYSNTTNRRFRVNSGTTNDPTVTGLFEDNKLYNIQRISNVAGGLQFYEDGVLQSISGGAGSSNVPNTNMLIGTETGLGNHFAGTLGFVAIYRPETTFNHAAWNTDVRQLLADLS